MNPSVKLAKAASEEYILKKQGYVYIRKLNIPGTRNSIIKTVK